MDDGEFALWAKQQRDEWERTIPLLENGTIQMFEMRNGVKVDTTLENIRFLPEKISELDGLLAKHRR